MLVWYVSVVAAYAASSPCHRVDKIGDDTLCKEATDADSCGTSFAGGAEL